MKRITAIASAALLLAALAFGCGKDPAAVQLPDPTDDNGWMTQPWTTTETETETEETTEAEETLPEGVYTSIVYLTAAPTTKPGATTSKPPALSGNATTTKAPSNTTIASATTARTTTTTTTTTKAPSNGPTQYYPNGISIASKDDALAKFNAAVKRVLDSKAGFGKSHMITYKDWAFDPALLAGLPGAGFIDVSSYISGPLNEALGKGVRSATVHKGDGTNLMRNSQFAMGDLKDVTYSGSQGREWTVTVLVKDGETRQEKRLFGSGITGNSPIDKGPLHMATGDGNLYDHMSADRVFSLVKSGLSFINADPIDISESTSQVKFVAKIDGEGKLVYLQATYNQTINLKEIRILNGADNYKDNTGSSTVTVTFDEFVY